jgi:hypothetical protein
LRTRTVSNPTGLSVVFPIAAWSDATGVFSALVASPGFRTLWSSPSTAVFTGDGLSVYFVSDGELRSFALKDQCASLSSYPNARGSQALAEASGYEKNVLRTFLPGTVASIARDGGAEVLLVDQPDDAGVLPVVARTPPTTSFAAYMNDIYVTTPDGLLLRQTRASSQLETKLSGLSRYASVAAGNGVAFVADRGTKQVLRVTF